MYDVSTRDRTSIYERSGANENPWYNAQTAASEFRKSLRIDRGFLSILTANTREYKSTSRIACQELGSESGGGLTSVAEASRERSVSICTPHRCGPVGHKCIRNATLQAEL